MSVLPDCPYDCQNGRVFMPNKGFVDCPHCKNIKTALTTPTTESVVTPVKRLAIPLLYENIRPAGAELLQNEEVTEFYSPASIDEVGRAMEEIMKAVYNSKVVLLSYYLWVPRAVDMSVFVYGLQKLALEKGLGVTPYITANTLYGLQRVGDYDIKKVETLEKTRSGDIQPEMILALDGFRVIRDSRVTYYDYCTADLCVIEASANTSDKGFTAIADLLSERSRRGLPTYIIGYWATKAKAVTSTPLKFLLSSDNSFTRLDRLVVCELRSKTSDGGYRKRGKALEGNSSIKSGVTLSQFFDGNS